MIAALQDLEEVKKMKRPLQTELREQIDTLETSNHGLLDEKSGLKAAARTTDQELSEASTANTNLRGQIQDLETANKSMMNEKEALETANGNIKQELNKASTTSENLRDQIKDLRSNKTLSNQQDALETAARSANQELDSPISNSDAIRGKLKDKQKRINRLCDSLSAATTRSDALALVIGCFAQRSDGLVDLSTITRTGLDVARGKVFELEGKLIDADSRCKSLEASVDSKRGEVDALEAAHSSARRTTNNQCESRVSVAQNQVDELSQKLSNGANENGNLATALDTAQSARRRTLARLVYSSFMSRLSAKVYRELQEDNDTLQEDNDILQDRTANMETSADTNIKTLERRLSSKGNVITKISLHLSGAQEVAILKDDELVSAIASVELLRARCREDVSRRIGWQPSSRSTKRIISTSLDFVCK